MYNYNTYRDYEEDDEESDERYQRYYSSRPPSLRNATQATLTSFNVNLLVKKLVCLFACTPCGLRGAAA